MSLITHAEQEMRRAGLYDKDADYGGMVPKAVMDLVKAHAAQGHSGGSHWIVLQVFNKVINFKTLTPLTNDPSEWMDTSVMTGPPGKLWQNKRDPSWFSTDGGKTGHSVDNKEVGTKTFPDPKKTDQT